MRCVAAKGELRFLRRANLPSPTANKKTVRETCRAGCAAVLSALLLINGCMVGPKYQKPDVPTAPAFKEPLPDSWKQAQPNAAIPRGKWWEIYNDPALNALEEQVNISNQNVLVAEAQYREARDQVRIARSALFPTVTAAPTYTYSKTSQTIAQNQIQSGSNTPATTSSQAQQASAARSDYSFPVDVSYQADVWGNIRRSVTAARETAQSSAADLENARLSFQAELAEFYFELHGLDGDADLLKRTMVSFEQYLQLTKDRFDAGIASGGDVAQAQTQLETTRAQLIDIDVSRRQTEHAIAILVGKPPSEVTIPPMVLKTPPPMTPQGIPSALLERRPDIAASERLVAAANEQIGIAKAAYFPTVLLSATGGFESPSITSWFTWPSRFWSLGPQFAEILFDAGKRKATVDFNQAAYDVTVATYRQTVLTAFQQIEDQMAALHVLEDEAKAQDVAVKAAEDSLAITTEQYKAGTSDYLTVITTQSIALADEKTAVDILTRRLTASVLLVEALGGGWDVSQLPKE
jgi:NodT family efflux transporter outer membrane factor (OMF) lipoprotein